jgi:CelD/BcsL family acetyltransferase involved in cellulose biosynthesis
VRAVDLRSMPAETTAAWADLEERALEPNAYLSPHFVLPSARYVDPQLPLVALLVEHGGGRAGRQLVAVIVAQAVVGTRSFPVPHLLAYCSRFTFLSGVLLDREHAEEALEALFHHIWQRRWGWHGLELDCVWGEGVTWDLLRGIGERRRMRLQVWNEMTRAVLLPQVDRARIEESAACESKNLRRRLKRLSEKGEVRWSILARGGIPDTSTEAFIDLEHRGWKGDNGSSLRSNASSEAFFRDVVARFGAQDRAVFVELQVDGKVVAATSNFISGQGGFAFKIGWLPELASMSPGRLAELGLLREIYNHDALSGLQFWDSGAVAGSYIEKLWPGRRQLVTLGIGCSLVGVSALAAVHTARTIKRELRARRGDAAPAATVGKPMVRPS